MGPRWQRLSGSNNRNWSIDAALYALADRSYLLTADRANLFDSGSTTPSRPASWFLNSDRLTRHPRMTTAFRQGLRRLAILKKDLLASTDVAAYLPEQQTGDDSHDHCHGKKGGTD